ncbi:GNAT family N-acetyltransferase [Nocardia sp. NPDC101769]|uniref:GNAT family N-acetyltransferase n=1 Tax=Nocardia sp. NPDC101769 TaxID=3364333 RepID=UPI003817C7AE
MDEVSVRVAAASEVAVRLDAIGGLYQQAFAEPPNVAETPAEHRATLLRLLSDPSFGCALAEVGGELVGFVYGYQLTASGRWWDGLRDPMPQEFTTEWEGRTFAIIDIAVAQPWRRHGIGARLMDTLLCERAEQRATLGMIPGLPAAEFYTATGWDLLSRQDSPPDAGWTSPVFDVYVRELTGTGSR